MLPEEISKQLRDLCLEALQKASVLRTALGRGRRQLETDHTRRILHEGGLWYEDVFEQLEQTDFSGVLQEELDNAIGSPFLPDDPDVRFGEIERLVEDHWNQSLVEEAVLAGLVGIYLLNWRESYDFGIESAVGDFRDQQRVTPERFVDFGPDYSFELRDDSRVLAAEERARWLATQTSDAALLQAQRDVARMVWREGRTVEEAVGFLREQGMPAFRARRIAVSEVQGTVGLARHEMFLKSGVGRKRRITVGDARVRPHHAADEKAGWIPLDQPYPASGAMYVGEGLDGIFCRCVQEGDLSDPNIILQPWDGEVTGEQFFDLSIE